MKKTTVSVISALTGLCAGIGITINKFIKLMEQKDDNRVKMEEFYYILNRWLEVKQKGKNLKEFFEDNEFSSIAIYGTKELGIALYRELKDTNIQVLYAIDQNPSDVMEGIKVYTPQEDLPQVDVIVITAPHYYNAIEDELYKNVNYPVVSIEDVVCEVDY